MASLEQLDPRLVDDFLDEIRRERRQGGGDGSVHGGALRQGRRRGIRVRPPV